MKRISAVALAAVALGAFADDKAHHNTTTTPTTTPVVVPSLESTVNTTLGGASQSSSTTIEGDRALALATGAPIPAMCPPGLIPGRGMKRGFGAAFGLWGMSGTCQAPTETERSALDAQRAHELELARVPMEEMKAEAELLRAKADADRAAAERAEAECDRCSAVRK